MATFEDRLAAVEGWIAERDAFEQAAPERRRKRKMRRQVEDARFAEFYSECRATGLEWKAEIDRHLAEMKLLTDEDIEEEYKRRALSPDFSLGTDLAQ